MPPFTLSPPPATFAPPDFQPLPPWAGRELSQPLDTSGFTIPLRPPVLSGGIFRAVTVSLDPVSPPLRRFDLAPHAAVTEGDVRAFEGERGLRVLRAGAAPGTRGARAGLARVAPVLDALVEGLWRRDQVSAGVTPGDTGDPPA